MFSSIISIANINILLSKNEASLIDNNISIKLKKTQYILAKPNFKHIIIKTTNLNF